MLELPPQADSPARARQYVERVLAHRCPPAIVEAASLLVSELVTNAVRHAGTTLTLKITSGRDKVRIEVRDHSERMPEMRVPRSGASGRGLLLVDRIAQSWGTQPEPDGKTVWLELNPQQIEEEFSAG